MLSKTSLIVHLGSDAVRQGLSILETVMCCLKMKCVYENLFSEIVIRFCKYIAFSESPLVFDMHGPQFETDYKNTINNGCLVNQFNTK